MLLVIYALVGLAIGSFLNVVVDRLPKGESLVSPSSRCDSCKRPLAWWENIPLASYTFLRGKCRTCGARIPQRVLWVELITGLLFAFLWWHYGAGVQLAIATVYTCIFLALAFIDLEHKLLLNIIIYPAIPLAFVFSFFWPELGWWDSLAGGAAGFGALFLIWLVANVIYKSGGMGEGDVKLAALIGLMTGFPLVVIALQAAIFGGGVLAIFLLLFKIKSRKDAVPFGPFLAAGALATLYYGQELWDMYIRWFTEGHL